jgi:hypothetical protein
MQLKHKDRSYPDIISELRKEYAQLSKARAVQAAAHNGSRPDREKIEEAVREELARATGQSIEKVDQCLCHGEYLTEDCLRKLGERGAEEDFFLKAQHLKATLIKNALIKGLGKQEITREISAAVLLMHQEYKQTGKVNATKWLRERAESSETKPTWASGTEIFGKPQILKYSSPKTAGSAPKTLTLAEITVRIRELARETREIVGGRNKSKAGLAQGPARLTAELAKLHQEARHQTVSREEKERDG